MPRARLLVAGLAALPFVLAATRAHADHRAFTHTFEYMTMPENETELDLYSDQNRVDLDGIKTQNFGLSLEVQHGITDHWDVALYHVFAENEGTFGTGDVVDDGVRFDAMHLQSRYRFAERGDWPVDVELIGDAARHFGAGHDVYEGTGKLVLARELDKLTIAANGFGDVVFGPDADAGKTHVLVGWAGGANYEVLASLKVGGESWGQFDASDTSTVAAYAGPVLAWNPSTTFWAAVTPGFGINKGTAKYDVQLAIGLHLD